MTAEIVIMNKEAAVIAADSAVSLMRGESGMPTKIFTSANKIFELSRGHAVGIMIYNDAAFMGIPWEPVIDAYRKKIGAVQFDTLKEYADDFIKFITTEKDLIPSEIEVKYFVQRALGHFYFIRGAIQEEAAAVMQQKGAITEDEIREVSTAILEKITETLNNAEYQATMDEAFHKSLFASQHDTLITAAAEIFENIPMPEGFSDSLSEIAVSFFVKVPQQFDPIQQDYSGLVIIGFGKKEIMPSLVSVMIEGRIEGHLKFWNGNEQHITYENNAVIIPFAQHEMVDMFMSGIETRFEFALLNSLAAAFQEFPAAVIDSVPKLGGEEKNELLEKFGRAGGEVVETLKTQLDNYRISRFIPIVNVVAALPKSDMALFAESLVNLTSLKRRVSMEAETVGGPADVAVISKTDGLIWIKRKQYFKREYNPQLFSAYTESGCAK